jgi:hypothetical protein
MTDAGRLNSIRLLLFRRLLPAIAVVATSGGGPLLAQQGPTGTSCTAYMNSGVVGRYNCLVGIDSAGHVNFMRWDDGTASTGLGGWVREGKNCFAASEERNWKICRD